MATGLAAAPAPTTVHANLHFSGLRIFHESQQVVFVSADNATVYPISYNGSVYLPIRSAGEWMGREVAWDAAKQTVTLSGSVPPEVKGRGYQTRPSTQSELDTLYAWMENGVDVQLRPDIAILADGNAQSFANVKGEPVYPIVWNGTVYLPLRNIGSLCGLEVSYVPDYLVAGNAWIYMRTAMTDSEKKAIASYLDTGIAMGAALIPRAEQFLNLPDSAQTEALSLLRSCLADLTKFRQLAKPGGTYLNAAYATIQSDFGTITAALEKYVAALEGGMSLATLRATTDLNAANPAAESVGIAMAQMAQTVQPYLKLTKSILLMAGGNSY